MLILYHFFVMSDMLYADRQDYEDVSKYLNNSCEMLLFALIFAGVVPRIFDGIKVCLSHAKREYIERCGPCSYC